MATLTSTFDRRFDKRMHDFLSRSGKRKLSYPTPSTRSYGWAMSEQHILQPFEKRKKIAQGSKPTLIPVSSLSALSPTQYITENSDVLNASSNNPRLERCSRNYAHTSSSRRAIGIDYSAVADNVLGGRVRSEPGGSPRSLSMMAPCLLKKWWTSDELVDASTGLDFPSDAKRALEIRRPLEGDTSISPQRPHIQDVRLLAEDLHPARDQFHKECMAYRDDPVGNSSYRGAIAGHYGEGPDRARAQDLKGEMSLEQYRELVNARTKSVPFSAKELALGDQGNSDLVEDLPVWKKMYNNLQDPTRTDKEIAFLEAKLEALQLQRPASLKAEKKVEEDPKLKGAFTSLSDEAEQEIDDALEGSSRYEVLVLHEKSNIEVTVAVMQCLLPGAWLNDEVINVYMELLKEREAREHDRFLRCHFFNTFFYNKLYKDKRSYDYKAIRRWTTAKKLGYSLCECDKILVPIHQDIHWCLAVVNIKEKKLEYLDSLKGGDRAVLDVLARYISDEARDKNGKDLDASTWERSFPKDIPEQLNGCDCGMFMLKYADFHSRDASLSFTQDNMNYFRRKMVYELLRLKAT